MSSLFSINGLRVKTSNISVDRKLVSFFKKLAAPLSIGPDSVTLVLAFQKSSTYLVVIIRPSTRFPNSVQATLVFNPTYCNNRNIVSFFLTVREKSREP
ncbi:hypothetical protein J6590_014914 [Homalodisca vitripennis]|nr:hypothetical protein J6590_014914 [Homalodisca vitripennis]